MALAVVVDDDSERWARWSSFCDQLNAFVRGGTCSDTVVLSVLTREEASVREIDAIIYKMTNRMALGALSDSDVHDLDVFNRRVSAVLERLFLQVLSLRRGVSQ